MPNVQLANCKRCGKVFLKGANSICPNCMKEIEEEYEKCAEYLRENKDANIYDLSEATGVSIKQITQYIKEGRITVTDNPNLGYPCESCGTLITEGRLCYKCTKNLQEGIQRANEDREKEKERLKERRNNTYYEMGSRFNNE